MVIVGTVGFVVFSNRAALSDFVLSPPFVFCWEVEPDLYPFGRSGPDVSGLQVRKLFLSIGKQRHIHTKGDCVMNFRLRFCSCVEFINCAHFSSHLCLRESFVDGFKRSIRLFPLFCWELLAADR